MPFKSPYTWALTQGDLVYGIHDKRTELVKHLGFDYFAKHGKTYPAFMTIDQFDRPKVEQITGGMNKNTDFEKLKKTYPFFEAWRDYHKQNAKHPKYKSYTQAVNRGNDSESTAQQRLKDPAFNSVIRRKCKFGLYWAIKGGHTIHFCLDGLSMAAIAGKRFKDDQPRGKPSSKQESSKVRAVTGSELRWIYRHRKVKEVQECVQFWSSKRPVGPPWDEPDMQEMVNGTYVKWKVLWAAYKPAREPLTLELEVNKNDLQEQKLKSVKKPVIEACSECRAADRKLSQSPGGGLVCEECRLKGLEDKKTGGLGQIGSPSIDNNKVVESKQVESNSSAEQCCVCNKKHDTQSSWYQLGSRWHQCQSCGNTYCPSCGSKLSYVKGSWSWRVRTCGCGGCTTLDW